MIYYNFISTNICTIEIIKIDSKINKINFIFSKLRRAIFVKMLC